MRQRVILTITMTGPKDGTAPEGDTKGFLENASQIIQGEARDCAQLCGFKVGIRTRRQHQTGGSLWETVGREGS